MSDWSALRERVANADVPVEIRESILALLDFADTLAQQFNLRCTHCDRPYGAHEDVYDGYRTASRACPFPNHNGTTFSAT